MHPIWTAIIQERRINVNIRYGTIIAVITESKNVIIVKTDNERRLAIYFNKSSKAAILFEFRIKSLKSDLISKKVRIDFDLEKIFAVKASRTGIKWTKAYYLD